MTFTTAVWAVDGNAVDAGYARLMLQAATLGAQGVVSHLDCQVQATTPTPTAGIVITPGQVVVAGAETPYQGSYHSWNIGNDTTLTVAATGGAIRSDMVVARAEDPTWSGSPWGNPAAGQIVFPRIISGVAAGALVPPAGISAIPLARIDMPASTSTVQQTYIHDLRQVAIPQTAQQLLVVSGAGGATFWSASPTAVEQWPPGATWSLQIPGWATQMILSWQVAEIQWGAGNVRGFLWPVIGSSVSAPLVTTHQSLVSLTTVTGPGSHTIGGGGQVAIPASIRGTTQTLQFAHQNDGTNTGTMRWADYGTTTVLVQFQQLAAAA